jgi:FtsP/CotA-like multicopper oxidase with cupredoxin domain/peroxiredoxin
VFGQSREVFQTIETAWAAAVESNDPLKIGAFLTDDFLFVGAGGTLQNRTQHLDEFSTGRLKIESVRVRSVTAHAYEGFAVVNSLVSVKGRIGDGDISGDYRFMDTFQSVAGKWLAVARQQTRAAAPGVAGMEPRPQMSQRLQTLRQNLNANLESDRFNQLKVLSAAADELDPHLPASQRLSLARAATGELINPPAAVPGPDGKILLRVAYADNGLGVNDPVTLHLRSYNGNLVGPTIRAKAGDTIRVRLVNDLPPEPGPVPHGDGHHLWNTTNLHTHGLHVSPQAKPDSPDPAAIESDNVLIDVAPGQTQEYAFAIPASHPAGTFWYHAHKHGSTSAQVSSGMAGALIVSRDGTEEHLGNLDVEPEVKAAMAVVDGRQREKLLVFQQMPFVMHDGLGVIELSDVTDDGSLFDPGTWHASGHSTTVNGKLLPVITFSPGEAQRWRMIHSGFRELLKLQLEKDPDPAIGGAGPAHIMLHEIAVDGQALSKRDTKPEVELYPGNRSDVLVQAPPQTGVYYLIDATSPAGNSLFGEHEPLKFIAKVVIADAAPLTMALPANERIAAHRRASLVAPPSSDPVEHAFYGITSAGFVIGGVDPGPNRPVNGAPFSTASTRVLTLGATQRWLIGTRNAPGIGVAHPFHIHVNPFEVVAIRGPDGRNILSEPVWRDTIAMPQGYTIEFLTKYEDFRGSFVQHCHILDHEDQGMMQKIAIRDPAVPPPAALRSAVESAPRPIDRPGENAPAAGSGRPAVLVFVKGSFCTHCMTQLTGMAQALAGKDVDVTVVSASSPEDVQAFPKFPFRVVADPELTLFKQYGSFEGEAKHATIVRDPRGKEVLRRVGDAPFADHEAVLAALRQAEPQIVIAVNNTDKADDDYITWAPTRCQIRIANPAAGGPNVTVTLTNNSTANPDAGQVRFAATLANGKTATDTTLMLTVKGDGTPTDFFIAGSKASSLTAASQANQGRDAVIEIHSNNAAGPVIGRQAVMVRVRKDFAATNALERHALQSAIAQVHTLPAGGGEDFYLMMLRIHSLSVMSPDSDPYPNQAHQGPAFLAWHRAYLLRFERELQKHDPAVSLHYWRMNQQPASGLPAAVFSADTWGSNPVGPGIGPVTFDAANPLFGWQINGELLSRNRRNRGDISIFLPEPSVLSYDRYRNEDTGDGFSENLESGNHNNGHGWVGSWMGDCQRSPRDPIFWLFHCDLDRSWALWQGTKGRFGTTGANENDYMPNDVYAAGSFDAKGQHLKDTMWPWDGVTGPGAPGDSSSDRPPQAPGGMFPAALLPGIWPAADAKPRPADMIDYLGVEDRAHNLGYCYDIVPFGPVPAPPAPVFALRGSLDANATWTERRNAVRALNPRKAKAKLLEVLTSKKNDDSLRIEALQRLARGAAPESFDAAIAILRDPDAGGQNLQLAVVQTLGELCLIHRLPAERHHAAQAALAEAVRSGPIPLRRAAIESLAAMQAPAAATLVREQLESREPWLSSAEAIPLLKVASPQSPETAAALRRFLESADPETRSLAILGLEGDRASRARRLELLVDLDAPLAVRRASLKSVMHADPGFPEAALRVALDSSSDLELRREAVAGLAVFARGNRASKETLTSWIARLRPLESAPQKSMRATAALGIEGLEKLALAR